MFRSLILFGLASSLIAVGQTPAGVTNNGGYVTPTATSAPLLTPPNAALPGSGPATGQPPAVGVNDPRYGGSGSVYQPSAGSMTGTDLSTPGISMGSLPTSTSSTTTSTTGSSFSPGMSNFSEATSNQPEESLGDIARRYKAQRAARHPRQFDNNSIRHSSYGTTDTNSAALPQGDQASAATYGSTGTMEVPEGVKNPADYAAVQAALARSQAASNTNASQNNVNSAMPDPNRDANHASDINQPQAQIAEQQQSAVQPQANSQGAQGTQDATTPQVDQTAAATQSAAAKKQLPASASSLPLIGLLGLIALTVGGIFTYRLRRSEY